MSRPHNLPLMNRPNAPKKDKRPCHKQNHSHDGACPQHPLAPNRIPDPDGRDGKARVWKHKTPPAEMELAVRHARDHSNDSRCKEPETQPPEKNGSDDSGKLDPCRERGN